MDISISDPVRLDHGRATSDLAWATINGKDVFILTQRGHYADICYDHGALLAEQIETGVFPEIIDTIKTSVDGGDGLLSWIPNAIYRRISNEVFAASSDEFRAGAEALGDGIFDTLDDPAFSDEDIRDAVVAIDAGNCAEGLTRRLEKPLSEHVSGDIAFVLRAARRYRRGRSRLALRNLIRSSRNEIGRSVQRMVRLRNRVGFGCTAAGSAGALTEDGRALHARTFDGAFFAWNEHPGLFLIDERTTNADWHRYAAVGTAGLTYSGGISGLNEAGIAASIHQMSTARYDTGQPGRGYTIAPFLMQRILREASDLDQAEAVLRGARHFGSWTIVVTDAKAGAATRFEINGGTQTVQRMDLGQRFAQSNHFFADGMAETNDFFGDRHFTPTFGKWLESRARIETVTEAMDRALEAGDWGTDAAIRLMADHNDSMLDGAPRTFGRTIARAYGIMATIARMDPDRARAKDEIWLSIGNTLPGPHADYAGFAIDWDAMKATPVTDRPVRAPRTVSEDFAAAMADYVAAFTTLSRPRDARGGYLGRDPTDGEAQILMQQARQLIDRAVGRAENAGEIDIALRYARARLAHEAGDYDAAAADWAFLRDASALGIAVLDYERALIAILGAATAFAQGAVTQARSLLADGQTLLTAVRKTYFPRGAAHEDLDAWQDVVDSLKKDGTADLPEFDFVTVE